MPSFRDTIIAAAPPEEVWKILYNPARFPEWLAGVETVEPGAESADPDAAIGFTIYPAAPPAGCTRGPPSGDLLPDHRLAFCLAARTPRRWHRHPDKRPRRHPSERRTLRRERARSHHRFTQPSRNTCVQHQPIKLTNTQRGMAFISRRRRDRIVTAPSAASSTRWSSARIR